MISGRCLCNAVTFTVDAGDLSRETEAEFLAKFA